MNDELAHPRSKIEAQKRIDQIRAFEEELKIIESENILSLDDEQRSKIETFHSSFIARMASDFGIDSDHGEKQLSLGMKIASFIGAIALAASVFFVFYQFWGVIPTSVQVIILIASPILGALATMYAVYRDASGHYAKLVGMVTFACFVLNLSMFGQMFNITPSDNAFLVWAIFAFLIAYASDSRLLLAAGIICLACFLSARMGTWSGYYWLSFGMRPENFFPAAILLFLTPFLFSQKQFSNFDITYRVFAMLLFFIPVLILSNWGYGSYLNFSSDLIEGVYQTTGFAVSAAAIWLGIRKNWSEVVNTGNVFFVIFLYTKFYDWWWDWMPKYLFFLIIGLTAVLFLMIFKRLRHFKTENVKQESA